MRSRLPAMVLCGLLASCALAPRRSLPSVRLDGATLGLAQATIPPMPERWWEALGDPQLDALVEGAMRNNPSLAVVLARLEQASAQAGVSGSALLPRVDGSLSAVRERLSERYIVPPPYGGATVWDSQLNVGLNWDLDFWRRQRDLVGASDSRVRAASLDARAAELAIQAALVTTYLEFDSQQALAEVATQLQMNRARVAELTRQRVTAGIDNRMELAIATAPVPGARLELKKSEARIELLRHQLAELSGQGAAGHARMTATRLKFAGALALPDELPADLLLRRPDIQAALARVQAADASAEAARLARYPTISLNAFAGTAALSVGALLSAPARNFGFGPRLLLPIFDAGQLRARYRGASAELDGAIAAYHVVVLHAVREAGDQLSLVRAYAAEQADAQLQLDYSGSSWQLAERRFKAGLTPEQQVLEAQSRVLAARANLLSTQTLEAEARVALLVALGGSTRAPEAPDPSNRKSPP